MEAKKKEISEFLEHHVVLCVGDLVPSFLSFGSALPTTPKNRPGVLAVTFSCSSLSELRGDKGLSSFYSGQTTNILAGK